MSEEDRHVQNVQAVLFATLLTIAAFCIFGMKTAHAQHSVVTGYGIVCDEASQVERYLALQGDNESLIEQINKETKPHVCELLNVAFYIGPIIKNVTNEDGTWHIRRILVVGLVTEEGVRSVQPAAQYTAFLFSKSEGV